MNPAKAKTSTNGNGRKLLFVTATLIMECFLVGMAQIEQLQRALKELIDFVFRDLVGCEERLEVEVRESAIRNASWEQLPQAARVNRSKFTNLLENYTAQGILKHAGVKQPANFAACTAFDQHRAQKTKRISFEQWPTLRLDGHKNQILQRGWGKTLGTKLQSGCASKAQRIL